MKKLILAAAIACLMISLLPCNNRIIKPRAAEAAYTLTEAEIISLLDCSTPIYGRILNGSGMMYADSACTNATFEIPRTYYVKVIDYSPFSCRAVYCFEDYDYARAVHGYVRTDNLTFVSMPPGGKSFPNVFPEFEGNGIFYKNNRFDTFYSSPDTAADVFFYGYLSGGGKQYCYVLSDGKFGYYSADVFSPIDLPEHTDPLPLTRTPVSSDAPQSDGEGKGLLKSDTNKIIFISVSCVVAVCAVYLAFLPSKRKRSPVTDPDDE